METVSLVQELNPLKVPGQMNPAVVPEMATEGLAVRVNHKKYC